MLPQNVRDRLVRELDKRLDLDLDEILDSPKLRLKLSPAELDKSLLELYDNISDGPGGDLLRVIGGGGRVGMQNLYMRRRSLDERRRKDTLPELFPSILEDALLESDDKTPTERVRWALQRNLPKLPRRQPAGSTTKGTSETKMSLHDMPSMTSRLSSVGRGAFIRMPTCRAKSFSLLI